MTDQEARVALAWHDVTCPEAAECRDRSLHAASAPIASGGILAAFLSRLASLTPPAPVLTGGELREESVDLTPGVVWTDAQLAVVRDLAARTHRAETERDTLAAQVRAVERLAEELDRDADDYHDAGTRIAAADLIRSALGTPTTEAGQ